MRRASSQSTGRPTSISGSDAASGVGSEVRRTAHATCPAWATARPASPTGYTDAQLAVPRRATRRTQTRNSPSRGTPTARNSPTRRSRSAAAAAAELGGDRVQLRAPRPGCTPLHISANTSSRPSASVTTPARLLTPVSVPVFARTTPRPADDGVPGGEPVVQRAVAARDRQPGEHRPQELGVARSLRRAPRPRPAARRAAGRAPCPGWTARCRRPSARRWCRTPPGSAPHRLRRRAVERRLRRRARSRPPWRAPRRARCPTSQIVCSTRSEIGAEIDRAEHLGVRRGGALGDAPGVRAQQPRERPPGLWAGSATRAPSCCGGVDAAAVEHQRLDRGDEAARDVRRRPSPARASGRGSGWCRPSPW